ncbi:MAG: erythromycin esterase family protein [Acidobacteria bacterium]|nr:erythromycin esterase family protein [Acidobacteriota bacterium]
MKRALLVLCVLLSLSATAQRRRAVLPPHVSDATPAGWLTNHAYRIATTEIGGPSNDLQPLKTMIGNAGVVGLGDGTHGTHEFQTVKLRMIDFLVREMGFTALAMEAPFPDWTRLNDYVLGGDGDPRQILHNRSLGYYFWSDEEIAAVVDWMRAYNASRGDKPPVQIAGMDGTDLEGARTLVTQYLDRVDPAEAAKARNAYLICPPMPGGVATCDALTEAIRADVAGREGQYVGSSSQREFNYALHGVTLIAADFVKHGRSTGLFSDRDLAMADFAQFIRTRQSTGKLILWAHQEHLSKTNRQIQQGSSTGQYLAERIGADLYVIGNASAEGTFSAPASSTNPELRVYSLTPLTDDHYETFFRSAAIPNLLIPMRGVSLPDWLLAPHKFHSGAGAGPFEYTEELSKKFDAVMYIEHTTPVHSFW